MAATAALAAHLQRCTSCCALVALLDQGSQATTDKSVASAASAAGMAPRDYLAGAQFLDEYRLERVLGRGAMGLVYQAHDTVLDRPVAIKLIAAPKPNHQERERFLREARAIARLTHPNVISVFRVGIFRQMPYLVSELVSGRSLDQLSLPLPVDQVIRIGLGLCSGLSAAHERGVLHRDVKPANVMLTDAGEVKLLDFGLAKVLDDSLPVDEGATGGDVSLTRAGAVIGTPRYVAPEIWRGAVATEQSDLYSLGALLYELCSGQPPHKARTLLELSRLVQKKDARPLREVARGVGPMAEHIDRCLRRRPQERFASAAALSQVLAALVPTPGPQPAMTPLPQPASSTRARVSTTQRALRLLRAQDITAVLELLRCQGLVLVAGDARVGKSILSTEGVLPSLESGALGDGRSWSVLSLRPQLRPLVQLAERLAAQSGTGEAELLHRLQGEPESVLRQLAERTPGAGLLLFVDQAERLVTQSEASEAGLLGSVLGAVANGVPGVRVLLTLRGEFLARLATLPGLGSRVTRGLHLLAPLTEARALAQARDDPSALRRLGAAHRAIGLLDVAAALLERACTLAPHDLRARRLLALTCAATGQIDRAILEASEEVRLAPGQARALCLLGRLCWRGRRFEQARDALRQALALKPTHRLVHRWLGEALLALGETAEAALCFERAAELRLAQLTGYVPDP